jgi:hypothetical protein
MCQSDPFALHPLQHAGICATDADCLGVRHDVAFVPKPYATKAMHPSEPEPNVDSMSFRFNFGTVDPSLSASVAGFACTLGRQVSLWTSSTTLRYELGSFASGSCIP